MGKQKLCRGIVIGAVIGGLATLSNKEVRSYVKRKMGDVNAKTRFYLKNPSEAVRNVRLTVHQLNKNVTNGAESTINALEQIENTLNSVTKNGQKLLK